MDEILAAIAVTGVMAGAVVSTFRGWWNAPDAEKYSIRKLAGALLLAALQAPLAIGIASLFANIDPATGAVGVFFIEMSQGFSIDTLHSTTKN